MYIFYSNCHTNVGMMDTPMDIEYESGDSLAMIYDTFSILDTEHSDEDSDIQIVSRKVFSNSEDSDVYIVSRKASSDSEDAAHPSIIGRRSRPSFQKIVTYSHPPIFAETPASLTNGLCTIPLFAHR